MSGCTTQRRKRSTHIYIYIYNISQREAEREARGRGRERELSQMMTHMSITTHLSGENKRQRRRGYERFEVHAVRH